MRVIGFLLLVGACAPTVPPGSPAPWPATGPYLRDLGRTGGPGAWRLMIELAEPGYVLVMAAEGTVRLAPVALSTSPGTAMEAGRHVVIALHDHRRAAAGTLPNCATPVLRMEAVFPTGHGFPSAAGLGEPPLPAAAGPVPVLVSEPDPRGCATHAPPSRIQLFLLTSSRPFDPGAVRAALDALAPRTPAADAARIVADALGALLIPPR